MYLCLFYFASRGSEEIAAVALTHPLSLWLRYTIFSDSARKSPKNQFYLLIFVHILHRIHSLYASSAPSAPCVCVCVLDIAEFWPEGVTWMFSFLLSHIRSLSRFFFFFFFVIFNVIFLCFFAYSYSCSPLPCHINIEKAFTRLLYWFTSIERIVFQVRRRGQGYRM